MMKKVIRRILPAVTAALMLFVFSFSAGRAEDGEDGMIYVSCDLVLPEYCEYIVPENCRAIRADEWMQDSYYRAAITLFTILDFFGLPENHELYGDYLPSLYDPSYVGRDDIRLYILCQDARAGRSAAFIVDLMNEDITGILFDAAFGFSFPTVRELVSSYCVDGFEANEQTDLAEWYNIIQKLY